MKSEEQTNNPVDAILDAAYRLIENVCKLLLLTMVVVITYTVFARFVLNNTPVWGEELSIFCMVWVALLSSALAVRDGRHIRMTIINYLVPARTARILHLGAYLLILVAGLMFIVDGIELSRLSAMSRMSSLPISGAWLTVSMPLAGLSILLMLAARFRRGKW